MPMAFVKRPTSPLNFEPLETPPEDILWPGSDHEADEYGREKKRLRREILGKQYLEGRPLLIQIAGLRGPFNRGWINPWASKRRKSGTDSKRTIAPPPQAKASPHRDPRFKQESVKAKRKSVTAIGMDGIAQDLEPDESSDASAPKRIRRQYGSRNPRTSGLAPSRLMDVEQNHWLKSDKGYLASGFGDERGSPTRTPAFKPGSNIPAAPNKDRITSIDTVQTNRNHSKGPHDSNTVTLGFTPINNREGPEGGAVHRTSHNVPNPRVKEHNLFEAGRATRHGSNEARRLSQGAVQRTEMELQRHKDLRPPQQVEPDQRSSRLAPYVSEFVITKDTATSAPLKAMSNTSRPSPRTVPPSSNLPEFQYRHVKKGLMLKTSKDGLLAGFRPRSMSTSSSGSSEFSEQLEAAQSKAVSISIGSSLPSSSHPSSPAREKPETASVKRNTHALRRLTFTASGEPKIANAISTSRLHSSSSEANAVPGATLSGSQRNKAKAPTEIGPIRKDSTKSSGKSLSNGNKSRSVVLPEAQVLSDPPILARVPSGPSTELIETDKQSPKVISLGDEDSYLNLSTQAAMLKAQRSFQNEVLSPRKVSPVLPKIEKTSSPLNGRYGGMVIIPLTSERDQNRNQNPQYISPKQALKDEPLSTQAMADAISPFAISTIKKRPPAFEKRTNFAPSPTRDQSPNAASSTSQSPGASPIDSFHQPFSMSTSSSESPLQERPPKQPPQSPPSRPNTISKPPSSLTSFAALPNRSTLESSNLQDGQQQVQPNYDTSLPLDPFATPFATARSKANGVSGPETSLDINAAIEEAGSFLGDWDVEAEARREGNSSRRKDVGIKKGILSVGKGST